MSTTNPNEPTGSNIFNFLPGTVSAPGVGFMNIGGISGGFFEISHNLSTRLITRRSAEGYIINPDWDSQVAAGTNSASMYIDSGNDRELDLADFDDSLIDMAWWANPRYKGCKATGKAINTYSPAEVGSGIGFFQISDVDGNIPSNFSGLGPAWEVGNYYNFTKYPGDQTFGLNPVIQNETTAIYIANTVIGGEEDPQFATLEGHSYVGIYKIVIVNINSDTVDVIDRNTEGYEEFHRFITNDLPTGGAFSMKVLDESVGSKLKQKYFCKMNKGWLLKTFDFVHGGEYSGSRQDKSEDHLETNNSIYFYRDGKSVENNYINGELVNEIINDNKVPQNPTSGSRFRYATIDLYGGATLGEGGVFSLGNMGPSFVSSSIVSNKYTRQFYSGAFGLVRNTYSGNTNTERLASSDLGHASRFIGVNCLDFLQQNNSNTTLTEEEKTELHVTFLHGVKDFSVSISGSGSAGSYTFNKSANDERSIGTFEVDQNQTSLDIGDHCHSFLPQSHEFILKGANDGRFVPALDTFQDEFFSAYLQYTGSSGIPGATNQLSFEESMELYNIDNYVGCTSVGEIADGQNGRPNLRLQRGVNLNFIDDAEIYLQGGALGAVGYKFAITSSKEVPAVSANNAYNRSQSGSMTTDNYYGGYLNSEGSASLDWQLSFLDKDHTIITNINKDEELFDGIGLKGIAIIPEHTHEKVKRNLELYLTKAGLIDNAPEGLTNILIE
jgi:hypothetical protein